MDMLVCPHCKTHRIVASKVPRDVVVVMSCPSCHELSVLFRKKMIPLNRKVLEKGSMEERKEHLAHVIAEFIESSDIFSDPPRNDAAENGFLFDIDDDMEEDEEKAEAAAEDDAPEEAESPITQEEFDKFVRIDLKCLDNSAYFRRHFG